MQRRQNDSDTRSRRQRTAAPLLGGALLATLCNAGCGAAEEAPLAEKRQGVTNVACASPGSRLIARAEARRTGTTCIATIAATWDSILSPPPVVYPFGEVRINGVPVLSQLSYRAGWYQGEVGPIENCGSVSAFVGAFIRSGSACPEGGSVFAFDQQ